MLKLLNFEFKPSHIIEHNNARIPHNIINHSKFLYFFKLLFGSLGVVQLKLQLVLSPDWLSLVGLFVEVCEELVFGVCEGLVFVVCEGLVFVVCEELVLVVCEELAFASEELLIVVLLEELIFWQ